MRALRLTPARKVVAVFKSGFWRNLGWGAREFSAIRIAAQLELAKIFFCSDVSSLGATGALEILG